MHMRPEPTLGEPTTSIFPYPLPQIHDYTGQPEEENIKSLPVLVESIFHFILFNLIIVMSEDMIIFVFCCSLLPKYVHFKRLKWP